MQVEAIIEISKGSNIKYEYKEGKLHCDRILHTPVTYPFNYGYIENTLSGDSDALDIVVLCDEALLPTCSIKCRVIGVLFTEDESGEDPKVITVPALCVDSQYSEVNDISDLHQNTLEKLKFFFDNYKKLEKNKWVKIIGVGNKDAANLIIQQSIQRRSRI